MKRAECWIKLPTKDDIGDGGSGCISREGWSTILALSGAVLLSGCGAADQAHPQPIVTTIEIPVPVSSPCVPATLGPQPTYPDSDEALKATIALPKEEGAAVRYQLLAAGRPLRQARLNELEPVVAGCPKATK